MRKKLLSLALALVLALSLMPSAFAAEGASTFSDVPEHAWYLEDLEFAVEHGYISGTSANTFSPDAQVTRAQFVTILGRMLNVDTSLYTSSKFDDVDASSWYGPYVAWAADKGYVNGISVKEFAPSNNLSVEQMAAILDNYIRKEGVVITEAPVVYADVTNVSRWAVSSMEAMARYNLLHVDEAGNANPQKRVTRAEAVVSLVRLARHLNLGVVPPTEQTTDVPESPIAKASYSKIWEVHNALRESGEIRDGMSEKEIAIAYCRWMYLNCDYRGEGFAEISGDSRLFIHHSYGPLVLGYGVCDGLAKAYQDLLSTEGISCEVIEGLNHAWNVVVLDGAEYTVDISVCVSAKHPTDGSLLESIYNKAVKKYFYPDEFAADRKPLTDKLTDEEIQQLLDSLNN